MIKIILNSLKKGLLTEPIGTKELRVENFENIGRELKSLINVRFGRSLAIREVDTGSCGACESEISALNNPIYDIQRFGIDFVASPRHADALLVTGALSRNMAIALKKTFDAAPNPKFVIALGQCMCDESVFKNSYYSLSSKVEDILGVPVVRIKGCPPSPIQIASSLLAFLKKP